MIGEYMEGINDPALLVDAICKDCPIVGATKGFCEMTGYPLEHVLGRNCRMMLDGVPQMAISRSARKNVTNYVEMCQVVGLTNISEVSAVQPNARHDGSHFVNLFLLGLCKVRHRTLILGVQMPLGEGLFVRLSQDASRKAIESTRAVFKHIRDRLLSRTPCESDDCTRSTSPVYMRQAICAQPDFAFFAERLQDHCLLVDNGFTAIRREPQELALNCLVFGDRPVRRTRRGLSFSVLVNQVTETFSGLPVLGFTKRRPADNPDLYPAVTRCLGSSVLVGASGEAFARDQHEHFKIGFKQPPQNEVQYWSLQAHLPPHERTPPTTIQPGDVLQCVYLKQGHIQLLLNGNSILEFDVQRPLDEACDYYAVVDVCFSAYSLTILPSSPSTEDLCSDVSLEGHLESTPSLGSEEESVSASSCSTAASRQCTRRQCTGHDPDLPSVVNEVAVLKSIKAAVTDCTFMVTIADPRGPDCPLIAVSEEFVNMTGFQRSEILGVNCRFLNQGCDMDPSDLARLRISSATGAPYTAVIPNRKKSGELFLNLLDLRGLSIARNPQTGEDLWFLIGIQADVTDLAEDDFPEDHLSDLELVSDTIREKLAKELSRMVVGAMASTATDSTKSEAWQLLSQPHWRDGPLLRRQSVEDAMAGYSELTGQPQSTGTPPSLCTSSSSGGHGGGSNSDRRNEASAVLSAPAKGTDVSQRGSGAPGKHKSSAPDRPHLASSTRAADKPLRPPQHSLEDATLPSHSGARGVSIQAAVLLACASLGLGITLMSTARRRS